MVRQIRLKERSHIYGVTHNNYFGHVGNVIEHAKRVHKVSFFAFHNSEHKRMHGMKRHKYY